MARETQSSPAGEKKLEQYGVWVKVKPRKVTEPPESESSFELSDLESPKRPVGSAAQQASTLTDDEEKLLDELETELGPEESASDVGVPEEEPLLADEEELPDIESVTGEMEEELPEVMEQRPARSARTAERQKASPTADTGEVEVTLSEDVTEEDRFDDLEALESELASVASSSPKASSSSAEILAKIEDELRSIRKDLTELRGELSGLRKSAGAPAVEAPASGAEAQGGFFDEDEDETIALTGDELDNILNTADITEEAAETPSVELDAGSLGLAEEAGAAGPEEDVLSFDTAAGEEDTIATLEEDLEIATEAAPAEDIPVLAEDTLLPLEGSGAEETGTLEELPAELVLDELEIEPASADQAEAADVEELPALDLEGISEVESEATPRGVLPGTPEARGGAAGMSADAERSDETIDLETLDLGEEPTVIEAAPEQVEDLEAIPEAEAVEEEASERVDTVADEVDLEALAAEAESDAEAVAPVEDLEIGELESVTDEEAAGDSTEKEIEIAFEGEPESTAESLSEPVELGGLESTDQILEAEEVAMEEPTPARKPADGGTEIPDNLKDDIRKVLSYMDHLLEALPDDKIQEFASSDYFVMYKKLFEDLGLGE